MSENFIPNNVNAARLWIFWQPSADDSELIIQNFPIVAWRLCDDNGLSHAHAHPVSFDIMPPNYDGGARRCTCIEFEGRYLFQGDGSQLSKWSEAVEHARAILTAPEELTPNDADFESIFSDKPLPS